MSRLRGFRRTASPGYFGIMVTFRIKKKRISSALSMQWGSLPWGRWRQGFDLSRDWVNERSSDQYSAEFPVGVEIPNPTRSYWKRSVFCLAVIFFFLKEKSLGDHRPDNNQHSTLSPPRSEAQLRSGLLRIRTCNGQDVDPPSRRLPGHHRRVLLPDFGDWYVLSSLQDINPGGDL